MLIVKVTEIERQRRNEERRGCAKRGGFNGEKEKFVRERLQRRKTEKFQKSHREKEPFCKKYFQ